MVIEHNSSISDRLALCLFLGLAIFTTIFVSSYKRSSGVVIPGIIEAENLKLHGLSPGLSAGLQSNTYYKLREWSLDSHFFVGGAGLNSWIEFELPPLAPGRYHFSEFFSLGQDYGVVQVFINGNATGMSIDLWNDHLKATGELRQGVIELKDGLNIFRIQVVSKNPKSVPPFYQFAIDGITLSGPLPATEIQQE